MLSCCLRCRNNRESKTQKIVRTKNRLLKFSVCTCKKSKRLKEQEARALLSNFTGLKIPILI